MVRIAWEKVGKERLRDILNRVRSELLHKHKKTDVAYLYNLGPDWMEAEIWNELVAYWSTPEWRKKSEAGKANRNVEKDGTITKHSGGSIKLEVHENRLAKKLGRQPTQLELFRATHTKKGSQGVYIDGKSRRVDGAYLSTIAENVNDNCESQSAFDLNKWIEISGSSKGRVYGFGSSDIAKSGTPTTSFSCTSAHPGGPSQTMFSLEEVEQILEQNRIKMKQDMEQMQEQMRMLGKGLAYETAGRKDPSFAAVRSVAAGRTAEAVVVIMSLEVGSAEAETVTTFGSICIKINP
ncbi:uncharacterized protein LOC122723860 [Manihot esculenta]|uniref:uncharacterized protein LOC122723860 n=1 Tax=Manihot esculenta TaxID=3983 RepID=UPI001CC5AC28|nr:uncharacterized protein LOC122723860 [Manihot esculenta]